MVMGVARGEETYARRRPGLAARAFSRFVCTRGLLASSQVGPSTHVFATTGAPTAPEVVAELIAAEVMRDLDAIVDTTDQTLDRVDDRSRWTEEGTALR